MKLPTRLAQSFRSRNHSAGISQTGIRRRPSLTSTTPTTVTQTDGEEDEQAEDATTPPVCTNSRPNRGVEAGTIPPKMMIPTPLPIPYSVISLTNQTSNSAGGHRNKQRPTFAGVIRGPNEGSNSEKLKLSNCAVELARPSGELAQQSISSATRPEAQLRDVVCD